MLEYRAGHDIYGRKIDNHDANGELVECGICKKSVAAARFAPHLEKCMGLGRTGRAKRSAANKLKATQASSASEMDDPQYSAGILDNEQPLGFGMDYDDPYSTKSTATSLDLLIFREQEIKNRKDHSKWCGEFDFCRFWGIKP